MAHSGAELPQDSSPAYTYTAPEAVHPVQQAPMQQVPIQQAPVQQFAPVQPYAQPGSAYAGEKDAHGQAAVMQPQPMQPQPQPMQPMQLSGPVNPKNKPLDKDGMRSWDKGYCSCFNSCGFCCLSCFCPCLAHGELKTRFDSLQQKGQAHPTGGEMASAPAWICASLPTCQSDWADLLVNCVFGVGCIMDIGLRSDVRRRYGIAGNGCTDCLASCCCVPLNQTQLHHEIETEEDVRP